MKKLLSVFLILALLLPVSAFAVIGDSPFFGSWVARKHGSTANYSAIIYYLNIHKNTPSEYFVFYLHHGGGFGQGKISDSEVYSDHWEIVDNHLKIPTSGITSIEVYYDEKTDTLYTEEWPNLTFVRIP